MAQQRVYVATTGPVWQVYDLFPDRMRPAVLVGGGVGLRLGETCGLRPEDVDFMRGIVYPQVQYPAEPLKTKSSRTPVPIPSSLAAELSAHVAKYGRHESLLTGRDGRQVSPWAVERAVRTARKKVDGLPAGFRYHDLRHYFREFSHRLWCGCQDRPGAPASCQRKTTLHAYGHIWPDRDESTRAAVDAVIAAPGGTATEQRQRHRATAQVTAGLTVRRRSTARTRAPSAVTCGNATRSGSHLATLRLGALADVGQRRPFCGLVADSAALDDVGPALRDGDDQALIPQHLHSPPRGVAGHPE